VEKGRALAQAVFQSLQAEKEAGSVPPEMISLWRQLS
jgi:hypothetical protein